MSDNAPYSYRFDLGSLAATEKTIELTPNAEGREAIAAWAGVDSVDALAATVRVRRTGDDAYHYDARFSAEVGQKCVVTLAPLHTPIEGEFARDFRVLPQRPRRSADEPDASVSDDEIEVLPSAVIDLAAPVLEELALAIDPYPRAPGATFEAVGNDESQASPFAVLERLKGKA